ncbi:hypothetical protein BCU94_14050 [Shewanella sp. 10N.286.52.C2]|uniref:multiheme c-type cytochrome n=1 Tax=Shewanella sp. 10N.286.52.C2 TaxID=1880838 RepID=UPI000C84F3D5|nr:hypothetical protein [Shewanella sp. 10N.286.52.C2]PMG29481.1 hypothetical protein BCU94_14050 [Shewanella sp. 10N.286.52.C2]
MNKFNLNTTAKAVFSAGLLAFALTGCGSDGSDGKDGEDGEVAININSASAIQTEVELAKYDAEAASLTVEFLLTNPNGVAITGLDTLESQPISLNFGRMGTREEAFLPYDTDSGTVTSRGDGDREIWLSYMNKEKGEYIAGSSSWSLSSCPEDTECLTYLGQGKYSLTVPAPINTLTLDYGYDDTKTQGIFLRVSKAGTNQLNTNSKYYWEPATEESVSAPKLVTSMETCTNCHVGQDNIRHSDRGNTAAECVFCHTDYNIYTGTDTDGNEFTYDGSIKGLVHGIHTGATETDRRLLNKFAELAPNTTTGVIANKDPSKNPAFSFKHDGAILDSEGNPKGPINFPTSMSNCDTCHVDYTTTEETLPEGVTIHALDWFADMDADSCQNCHGDYHNGGRTEETESGLSYVGCVTCHNSDDAQGSRSAGGAFRHIAGHDELGNQAAAEAGKLVEATYSNLVWTEGTSTLTFTMNLMKGEEAVTSEFVPSVTVYVNAINAESPDAYLASRTSGAVTENTDGSYLVTVDATAADFVLPSLAEAINSGADLAITSSFSTCFANKSSTLAPLTDDGTGSMSCGAVSSPNAAKTAFLKLDGSAGAERASAAAYDNCSSCHNNDMVARSSGYHYRNADLHTCAQCHEAGDYNSMVVRVHGTFGKAHGREDVQDLVSSNNCSACHSDTNYSLENARSTPMRWNRVKYTPEELPFFSSPQAGVCASCHVSDSYEIGGGSASAEAHITNNGGVVAGTYEDAQMAQESCATCHSASKIAEVHGVK